MTRVRFKRLLFNMIVAVASLLLVTSIAMWIKTEWGGLTHTLIWAHAGEYHSLEFSGDDAKYRILHDPGINPQSLALHTSRGWVRPPLPSNTAGRIFGVIYVLPQPRGEFPETRNFHLWQLGFDYAEFDQWYGLGTTVHAYRISYFLVMLPALAVVLVWIGFLVRDWYRHRRRAGFCGKCGYDLRASADRCPECGAAIAQPT